MKPPQVHIETWFEWGQVLLFLVVARGVYELLVFLFGQP